MQRLDFSDPSSVGGWVSIDDRVMGGVSSSRLRFHPDGHAVFEGDVSSANGGGFASVRHPALRLGLHGTEGYRLHVRGDGRRFKLNLRMEGGLDGVNYQAVFQPPAGHWVEILLPISTFSPRYRGRSVSNAEPLRPEKVCQLGWMVADGQVGAFELAIRSVTAVGPS